MYGTLGAASDFQDELRDGMEKDVGMISGASVPTLFYDAFRDIAAVGHGDDIMFEAPEVEGLEAIGKLGKRFDLVVKAKLGPEPGDSKEALLLNRVLTWAEVDGKQVVRWEADPRQLELLLAEVGCAQCKPQVSPGVRPTQAEWDAAVELPEEQAKAYRRSTARLNYLCSDRPDVVFSGKEGCRGMALPSLCCLIIVIIGFTKCLDSLVVARKVGKAAFAPSTILPEIVAMRFACGVSP